MVPGEGVEPTWPCGRGILNPLRLPVSPSRRTSPLLKFALAYPLANLGGMVGSRGLGPSFRIAELRTGQIAVGHSPILPIRQRNLASSPPALYLIILPSN